MYYLMAGNDDYEQPGMPEGCEEGIIRGIYKYRTHEAHTPQLTVNLFGSGAILNSVLAAQHILADKYHISSHAWSVTSYNELRRDAPACERWHMFHPDLPPRKCYIEEVLAGESGVFVAASDYVRALPEQLTRWIPGDYYVLGTDGMGRSESREALRRHFEVDAESIVIATLYRLARLGKIPASDVAKAIQDLGVNPEKVDPYFA
jgi:pyruvate dehydrogenase E1 component